MNHFFFEFRARHVDVTQRPNFLMNYAVLFRLCFAQLRLSATQSEYADKLAASVSVYADCLSMGPPLLLSLFLTFLSRWFTSHRRKRRTFVRVK